MKLRVKYSDKEYAVPNVPEVCTGKEVKELVSAATGIEAHRIKLICMGKVLKDDKELAKDYKIADGSLMHMVAREPEMASQSQQQQPAETPAPAQPTASSTQSRTRTTHTTPMDNTTETSSSSTAEDAAPAPDLSQVFGMLGGMFGGLGGAGGPGATGATGETPPGGAAGLGATAGPAIANLFQNIGSMAANARATSGANATTSYTTSATSPDGRAQTTSTTSSTTSRTGPGSANARTTAGAGSTNAQTASPRPPPTAPPAYTSPQPTAASAQQEQAGVAPPVAGIHVHIHVTLDELDILPKKLEKFVSQVPNAQVHVEEQPTQTTGQRASAMFQGMRPAMERAVNNANAWSRNVGRGGGSVNDFFARTGSSSSADHNARGAEDVEPEDVVLGQGGEETKKQQPAAQEVHESDEKEEEDSLLSSIGGEIKSQLQMPDYMALIAGDWSSMAKVHGPLHTRISGRLKTASPTDLQLKKMSINGCKRIRRRLQDPSHPLAQQLKDAARPGVDVPAAVEAAMQHAGFDLASLVMRKNALQFAKGVRPLVVLYVGMLYKYAKENWFNSQAELDAIIKAGVTFALSSDTAKNDPTMATMAPMLMPMVVNTIQLWAQEYERGGTYLADVANLVSTPLDMSQSHHRSGNTPPAEVEDVLLDACFDEVTNGWGSSAAVDAALDAALQGMDANEAARLRREVQGGLRAGVPVGSTQTSENYNSLYKKAD